MWHLQNTYFNIKRRSSFNLGNGGNYFDLFACFYMEGLYKMTIMDYIKLDSPFKVYQGIIEVFLTKVVRDFVFIILS